MKRSVKARKAANKRGGHIHIQEIPLRYLPKKTNTKEYRDEVVRMMTQLKFANERVQYSAQITSFNIRSITHKNGFIPQKSEVFRQIQGFVYHYENYCFRAYAYREKILKFLNAGFELNLSNHDAKMKLVVSHPIIEKAQIAPILERFDNKRSFGKVIGDRNELTHKLYYGKTFDHFLRPKIDVIPASPSQFKQWCSSWRREVTSRSKLTQAVQEGVSDVDHQLATRYVAAKRKGMRF
jgi:hypothetical protein